MLESGVLKNAKNGTGCSIDTPMCRRRVYPAATLAVNTAQIKAIRRGWEREATRGRRYGKACQQVRCLAVAAGLPRHSRYLSGIDPRGRR
jgi:hypothetical protein